MTFDEYRQYDALGLATLIQKKEIQASELLELAIQRQEAVHPQVNAIIRPLYEHAKKQIDTLSHDMPFTGVPFVLKDLGLPLKGTEMNVGSAYFKGFITKADSLVVEKIKKAGFLIFGKTNTPEFGLTPFTEPQLHGITKNPWNLEHSAGGSSGGSGAAVAAGIIPMATASDGGGSIRIPASCCGLVGHKPSRGLVSLGPSIAEAWGGLVVENCVSRSVRDSAAYLDVIKGTAWGEISLPYESSSYLKAIDQGVRPLKIGFSTQHPLNLAVDQDCIDAVKHTAKLLQNLGHEVEEVPLPYGRAAVEEIFLVLVAGEAAADLQDFEDHLGRKVKKSDVEPNTWGLSVLGRKLSASDYALARKKMGYLSRKMGKFHLDYDLLLTPTLANAPIKHGQLQNSGFEKLLVQLVNTFELGAVLKMGLQQFTDKAFGYIPYTILANMTGQPSISLPLHWNENKLPIGVMFTGRMGEDALLLQLAKQLEEAQPWFDKVAL